MRCEDCAYYWQDENDSRACCHWVSKCPGDIAPCEEETEEDWDYHYE